MKVGLYLDVAVGVQSKVGAGCLFWFELARADSSPAYGGTAPAVFNGADEVCVDAFLDGLTKGTTP